MADYDEEEGAPQPVPNYVPALAQLSDALTSPVAQDAIGEAAAYLNNHIQQRQIADANEAAGENFVNDMASFKSGMTSFVRDDPTGVFAAMDAVNPVVNTVVRTIPGHEDSDDHVNAIIGDYHREIAHAAITSAAEQNDQLARGLLDHPRIAGLLPEEERANLGTYIDMQAGARAQDHAAQEAQLAVQADRASQDSMFKYAKSLWDENAGKPVFPDGWNQALLADNSVTPRDTAGLRSIYSRLADDSGASVTDPFLVHSIAGQVASGNAPGLRDVMGHAIEGNLTYPDALHLGSLAFDQSEGAREHAGGLYTLLEAGRSAILGEDPVAGQAAFSRFVNWALPNYMRTGSAGLNPEAPNYLLPGGMEPFMPVSSDYATPRIQDAANLDFGRRPLNEIFSGGKSSVPPEVLDYALKLLGGRGTLTSNEDVIMPSSGTEFPTNYSSRLGGQSENPLETPETNADTVIHYANPWQDTLENYVDPSNSRGTPKQGESYRDGRHRNRARNT